MVCRPKPNIYFQSKMRKEKAGHEIILRLAAEALGFDISRLPAARRTYPGSSQRLHAADAELVDHSAHSSHGALGWLAIAYRKADAGIVQEIDADARMSRWSQLLLLSWSASTRAGCPKGHGMHASETSAP